MIRSYNFTDRQKIPRNKIRIILKRNENSPPEFEAEISVDENGELPVGAQIYVEAYKGPVFQRFLCEEIDSIHRISGILNLFHSDSHVLFRVKLVDGSHTTKRILGWADRLNFISNEEHAAQSRCLLPVEPADLGDLIWKLEWEGDDPVLQVNQEIQEPRDMKSIVASDSDFLSLAYPEILSEIYRHLLIDTRSYDREQDSSGWLTFASVRLGVVDAPPDFDLDMDDMDQAREWVMRWIDGVVGAFCEENAIRSKYIEFKLEGFESA